MRILYGVCGEGFGHSSRAKSILEHLKKEGHEILLLTYGQAHSVLKEFNPINIFGIEIYMKEGRLSLTKSLLINQRNFVSKLKDYPKIKKTIDEFAPQVCISDMEPIVPIISFWKKLPLISIDNQHDIIFSKIKVPFKHIRGYIIAKRAIKTCISKANYFIILSFTKKKSKKKNVFFVNPILKNEIIKLKPTTQNFTLVYLTKPDDNLMKILQKCKEKFIVYGQKESGKSKNIIYKKKGKTFVEDLRKCKAIVATSGFSLMSEALYLQKPYFAIPLPGQFEQMVNSVYLRDSGCGEYSEKPKLEELEKFFFNLKKYKSKIKKYKSKPDEATKTLGRILKSIRNKL